MLHRRDLVTAIPAQTRPGRRWGAGRFLVALGLVIALVGSAQAQPETPAGDDTAEEPGADDDTAEEPGADDDTAEDGSSTADAATDGSSTADAADDEPETAQATGPVRRKGATLREVFAGPFQSSRLFDMPIADVVGAYQVSLSGDGSLLRETGLLSSAGVLAIGFGDIAQLEYRHTAVIGVGKFQAPIPAYGVQLKAPYPEHRYVPALAVAFRLGRDRTEEFDGIDVVENVTDLYVVGRLRLWGPLRIASLHGGVRFSSAEMTVVGWDQEKKRTMYLPAGGWEIKMNRRTRLIGEAALVPIFELQPDANTASQYEPRITYGVLGRMGIRWLVHPSFAIDASVGYQLEVAKLKGSEDRGLSSVVDWDMRLGGELHFPWGALVCRAAGAFCD